MHKIARQVPRQQDGHSLYDDDIVLWSEQQSGALRALKGLGDLPPELDIDNVVEEIEAVGRNETAAVESLIEQIFVHLLKITAEPNAPSVRHWLGEISGFSSGARRRFAPSMRRKIDLDDLWQDVRRQALIGASDQTAAVLGRTPGQCPLSLDDLLSANINPAELVTKLGSASTDR